MEDPIWDPPDEPQPVSDTRCSILLLTKIQKKKGTSPVDVIFTTKQTKNGPGLSGNPGVSEFAADKFVLERGTKSRSLLLPEL